MADEPPVSGELVSMVNCAVWLPPAGTVTLALEKWHVTLAGSDAQPSPTESVKLSVGVSVTVTVAFCEAASVTVGGATVRL